MTPLSDALTAAQRRALAALEKAYVAGKIDGEATTAKLEACGISDPVELDYLLSSLDVLREWGAPLPAEPKPSPEDEPATENRLAYIAKLASEKLRPGETPDVAGLTKAQASELIEAIGNGKWAMEGTESTAEAP